MKGQTNALNHKWYLLAHRERAWIPAASFQWVRRWWVPWEQTFPRWQRRRKRLRPGRWRRCNPRSRCKPRPKPWRLPDQQKTPHPPSTQGNHQVHCNQIQITGKFNASFVLHAIVSLTALLTTLTWLRSWEVRRGRHRSRLPWIHRYCWYHTPAPQISPPLRQIGPNPSLCKMSLAVVN